MRKYFEYEHSSSKNEWIFYHSIRTNMILSGSSKIRASRPPLPNGMAAPQIVLSSAPVSLADVQLVSKVFWIDTCSSFDKCLCYNIELSVHWSKTMNIHVLYFFIENLCLPSNFDVDEPGRR